MCKKLKQKLELLNLAYNTLCCKVKNVVYVNKRILSIPYNKSPLLIAVYSLQIVIKLYSDNRKIMHFG